MSKIFSNFSKVDFSTPEGREKVFAALQYFASGKGRIDAERKKAAALQALTGPGDFPTQTIDIFKTFQALPSYDTGYEEIFDMRDFTGTKKSGYKIESIEDGLSFAKVTGGGKAKIFKMAGTEAEVSFDLYGGGLGWLRTWIDDEEYWSLENNAISFVNKAAEDKAGIFYALIEALGAGYNVAWTAPDPAALANTDALYTANRDAQTLNAAAQAILLAVKDKGYGVTLQNVEFIVAAPIQLVGRLNKALGLMLQGFAGSPSQVTYKFRILPTTMFSTTTMYYVILPKHNLTGGNRMNLTIFNKFDEESYSDIAVGWQRYGGAIGDSDQLRRCAVS